MTVTPRQRWWFYKVCWHIWLVLFHLPSRVKTEGRHNLPPRGPFLLLANHVTWLDPVYISFLVRRPVRFMASVHWFPHPVLGRFLTLIGAIPKAKFTSDKGAILTMVRAYHEGDVIALFPEGERTWDGKTVPMVPGIGRLIKRLGAPVVCARIQGGHHQWPRWAPRPRWAPVRITFDAPRTFPADWTHEQIEDELSRLLFVAPDDCPPPRFAFGKKIAEGLPAALWGCPACMKMEALEVEADQTHVGCKQCGLRWKLEVSSRLVPAAPGAPELTVAKGVERLQNHYGLEPIQDPARFQVDGVVLESLSCQLLQLKPEKKLLGEGHLLLTRTDLLLRGTDHAVLWEMPLRELMSVSIEGRATLTIRVEGALFELLVGDESRVKWAYFLNAYRPKGGALAHLLVSQPDTSPTPPSDPMPPPGAS